MILFNNKKELRYYVKIYQGSQQALAKVVYFRNELKAELYFKWLWYFKYREALFRISEPKNYTQLETGPYEVDLSNSDYRTKLKNQITAKKRKISELNSKVELAKRNWNELFPMEQHPLWPKVIEKVNRLKNELNELEHEYSEI